jgi:hypothetical protein
VVGAETVLKVAHQLAIDVPFAGLAHFAGVAAASLEVRELWPIDGVLRGKPAPESGVPVDAPASHPCGYRAGSMTTRGRENMVR